MACLLAISLNQSWEPSTQWASFRNNSCWKRTAWLFEPFQPVGYSLEVNQGLLYRHWTDADTGVVSKQLVVHKSFVAEVLRAVHDRAGGDHLGQWKTIVKVRSHFYWSGLREEVENWCIRCQGCAQSWYQVWGFGYFPLYPLKRWCNGTISNNSLFIFTCVLCHNIYVYHYCYNNNILYRKIDRFCFWSWH